MTRLQLDRPMYVKTTSLINNVGLVSSTLTVCKSVFRVNESRISTPIKEYFSLVTAESKKNTNELKRIFYFIELPKFSNEL